MKLEFSGQNFEKYSNINITEILSLGQSVCLSICPCRHMERPTWRS